MLLPESAMKCQQTLNRLRIITEFNSIVQHSLKVLFIMWAFQVRAFALFLGMSAVVGLTACSQSSQQADSDKVEIKAAPKLTHDATTYAHMAWALINEADVYVYRKQLNLIEEKVRKPVRKLSTDWRINVKMTDSVTEGQYAWCRKTLTSLDSWARASLEKDRSMMQKQADYERDKAQCKAALAQPELGNTSPKSG